MADPTLHLPRILCLHGGGTNARIFRLQCRALDRHLRSHFRLVYAEAPFEVTTPGPDVTSVYQNYGPFKAWLRMSAGDPGEEVLSHEEHVERIEGALIAAMCVDDLLGATGEWLGVLGFSQGAKLAASILYAQQTQRDLLQGQRQQHRRRQQLEPQQQRPQQQQQHQHPYQQLTMTSVLIAACDFRFGILMAGRGPLVWLDAERALMPQGMVDAASPSWMTTSFSSSLAADDDNPPGLLLPTTTTTTTNTTITQATAAAALLRVPTIHVHGRRDPNRSQHQALLRRCCAPRSTRLMEWDGEHRVPIRTADVERLAEHILVCAAAARSSSSSSSSGREGREEKEKRGSAAVVRAARLPASSGPQAVLLQQARQ